MKWQFLSLLIVVVIGVVAASTIWLVSQRNNVTTENSSITIPSNTSFPKTVNEDITNSNTKLLNSTTAATNSSNSTNPTNSTNITNANTNIIVTDNSDFNSCSVESTTLCNGLRDGKLALVRCLLDDHYDELSEACRNSLERRQTLNEELVAACTADRGTYCRGVTPEPGSEPMVDCLEEHYAQLSADCVAAFDAHAAAKPTQ